MSAGFLFPAQGQAFSEWQSDEASLSLRGFTGVDGGYSRNPQVTDYCDSREDLLWNLDQRLLATAKYREHSRFDLNLLQNIRATPNASLGSRPLGTERSGLLSWQQHDSGNSEASLRVDTAALHYTQENTEWSIGRQPVNLATTMYFSPNDFFAPFAAQTFYRTYKPGVDSGRVEVRLGNLAQLTLVGVLGYSPEGTGETEWRHRPDWSRNSLVARLAVNRNDWEWGVLGGSVREHRISGGSLQGELFDWLGIRAEGHYAAPEQEGGAGGSEASVGFEHRFASSLELRLEQFHHGQGYGSSEGLNQALAANTLREGYTGRDYTALGASYEFSPLLTGQALVLANWSDHSQLLSLNGVYSLSDEAELAVTFSLPRGQEPEGTSIGSEFGLVPTTVTCSLRFYY
ncbi:hypothetical protein [Thiovibrio frasassiensis]|uniref:Uncharacterized protein n=1 Tax=Thiovibrio frasassiensis TaxID=2984131 RepID=A0A9X4MJX9_9BACT|nr:hypothetical protein [Thiovibrio frasassiensis]MDG4476893.1 hypothetical protein [Thiovibrio frasassiensis]